MKVLLNLELFIKAVLLGGLLGNVVELLAKNPYRNKICKHWYTPTFGGMLITTITYIIVLMAIFIITF